MDKLIKNVDQESWQGLKSEAARHRLKIGEFLGYLVQEHRWRERKKPNAWDYILSRKKRLTNEEAKEIKQAVATFEEVYEFE